MHWQAHQGQPNGGGMPLNITQYKKTVSSALWVQITLVVCYLPYSIATIFVINGLRTQLLDFAWELTLSLFMLNSTLNPLLYCWKIKEIRQAVMDTLRRFSCFWTKPSCWTWNSCNQTTDQVLGFVCRKAMTWLTLFRTGRGTRDRQGRTPIWKGRECSSENLN